MDDFLARHTHGPTIRNPQSAISFKAGSRVRHGTLGVGIVKGTEGSGLGEKVTVQFPAGIKKLLVNVAGLEAA